VKASEGVAEIEVESLGAYTIGARVGHDGTRLELDLMTIPGGTSFLQKVALLSCPFLSVAVSSRLILAARGPRFRQNANYDSGRVASSLLFAVGSFAGQTSSELLFIVIALGFPLDRVVRKFTVRLNASDVEVLDKLRARLGLGDADIFRLSNRQHLHILEMSDGQLTELLKLFQPKT